MFIQSTRALWNLDKAEAWCRGIGQTGRVPDHFDSSSRSGEIDIANLTPGTAKAT